MNDGLILEEMDLVITTSCNLRCRMCDIWKSEPSEIPLDLVRKIASDSAKIKAIALTGGEPFLRKDLLDLFDILTCRENCFFSISTNGILTSRIRRFMDRFSEQVAQVSVSLDGLSDTHDFVRGVEGAFRSTAKTINMLTTNFDNKLKVKFTITPWNYRNILGVYSWFRRKGIFISISPVINDFNYTNQGGYNIHLTESQVRIVEEQLGVIIMDLMKNHRSFDVKYVSSIVNYLRKKSYYFSDCPAGRSSAFILPSGDVYSCRQFSSIGNMMNSDLSSIFSSSAAEAVVDKIAEGKCPGCLGFYGSHLLFR